MKRPAELDEDFLWYVEHPEAFEDYKGQHVAIWNKKVIGHGKTAKQAYDMAKTSYPKSKPTLAFIPKEEALIL